MELYYEILNNMRSYEVINNNVPKQWSTVNMSVARKMMNDELECESAFWKPEDRLLEKEYLKNEQNFVKPKLRDGSRRPGEFTEVDFPTISRLTLREMQLYTTLSIVKKKMKVLNAKDEELFRILSETLEIERRDYQAFVTTQWSHNNNYLRAAEIKPSIKRYIDYVWESRIRRLQRYPKHYRNTDNSIPLKFNEIEPENPVILKLGTTLLETGVPNSFVVPPLISHPREVTYLPSDFQTLIDNFHPNHEFLPPVSQDPNIEHLLDASGALKNEHFIVVMSGSGFKTIIDNFGNNPSQDWMLPITIKEHNIDGKKRKVVFIDKKLPPKNLSNAQRMKWYAKIALHMMMCKSNEKSSSDDAASFSDDAHCSSSCGGMTEDSQIEETFSDCDGEVMDMEDDFVPNSRFKERRKPVWGAGRCDYRIWHIGKETPNHLMKHQVGEIKILLRTKYDGEWVRQHLKKKQVFTVAPKLDYQCEYGGEILTTSEFIRQWADLHIRPGSFLKRARINPMTCEFMQLQTVCEADMGVEMRTHTDGVQHIADKLYSVISHLVQQPPANYILARHAQSGPFCKLYAECHENESKSCFELRKNYPEHPREAPPPAFSAPFLRMDPNFKPINCTYKGVLPLTFPPRKNPKPVKLKPTFVPKKKNRNRKRRNKKKKETGEHEQACETHTAE
ncbi:uncharacterized protein LOC111054042 isoform X4 [Nilaparvata lugens]|uniref:uncharacterized protein LOC111054042 isoform X3 n=1 Tax=Nilaparvata lugens TaxID=108931 RepID=UPI00193D861D|nr:uncharacterized protein LOC111054042 isoform X3 [Nilaparvata lugens]XP_039289047.1 uncharacterized protein LOC111054042 isoform X4 [Nilaparvata lugens]